VEATLVAGIFHQNAILLDAVQKDMLERVKEKH
jgi:hypothetical protein